MICLYMLSFSCVAISFNLIVCHRYSDHPHLPSFPTRRSSDLAAESPESGDSPDSGESADSPDSPDSPESALSGESGRSEEHTSELQSRGHLVCRLLLEKKNKK